MSDEQPAPLQFDSVGPPRSAECGVCRQPIAGSYYTVGAQTACERCKTQLELALAQRPGLAGFLRALALGSAAGLVGAAVWYGVRAATSYEIGILAIAIGWGVGTGVMRGSGGRGGLGFQVLAVVLTYCWIAANYVPDLMSGFSEPGAGELANAPTAMRLFVAVVGSLVLPFAQGIENAIGILIVGFGLYQAWTITKRSEIGIAGPFQLAQAPGAKPSV